MKRMVLFICYLVFVAMQSTMGQTVEIERAEIEKMMRLPQDDWLDLTLMGTKIGYAHIYMEKSEYEGEEAIRVRADTVMEIKRTGTHLRLETTRVSYVGTDLVPRYFISTSNETGQEKRVEGEIKNGIAYLKTTLAGQTTQSQQSIPPDTVFEQMISYLVLKRGIRLGDEYTLHVFNLDLLKPVETQVTIVREDSIEYEGEIKSVYVIDYTMDIMGGVTTTGWMGLDGTTYRMEIGLMGIPMVLTKTDMQTALGEVGEVDVILNTKIFAQGKVPIPNASYLKARLRLTKGELKKAVMTDHRQKVVVDVTNPRNGMLEIAVPSVDVSNAPHLPFQSQEDGSDVEQFLKSTVYIQTDDPKIRSRAVEIIDGETNTWKAAKKLCHWVHDNIYDKNLKVGFGSALQTLESLEGDCTEHTVLLIALARSVGIPARICAGIVFQRDAFYYHFWPEVYVGEWIAMEPTLGQIQADANHIQLAGSTLESDSMLEFGEGVMRTLNQLEIEVIE
ncbi:hypothetical protein IH992_26945 [Candidatus Poribacteria bacterium]|nr:hypothetical protein [Candidatus Poribacteria bacterium]